MNSITFNLIAVSIFVVTFLSLLGPLIRITPEMIAIATTGCFGLVILDRFGWEGRGGTLLIDTLSQNSPEYRQRVLYHEAGHFLVAYFLEIPIEGYTLSAWEAWKAGLPGSGGVIFNAEAIDAEVAQGQISGQQLNRYCTVWMAGIAAEELSFGSSQGGFDDRLQLQQLWQQLNRPPAEVPLKQRWAILQAKALLERESAAYLALVKEMAARGEIATCYATLEQHRLPSTEL